MRKYIVKLWLAMECSIIIFIVCINSCGAMSISQSKFVGKIIAANIGGFAFEGEIYNKGKIIGKTSRRDVYGRGVARLSTGKDAVYFHYDMKNGEPVMIFGDEKGANNVSIPLLYAEIYKMLTDNGITLYMVHDSYDLPEEDKYILLGHQKDGKWVKYFDTEKVKNTYFSGNEWGVTFDKFSVNGNTIVVYYKRNTYGLQVQNNNINERGEFRFKWDEKANWFGLEQVVY